MAQQARNDRTLDNVQDGQPREDTEQEANSTRSRSASMSSEEGPPPPLPPRPKTINLLNERPSTSSGGLQRSVSSNQSLPPQATTAVSLTDVNTQSFQDGTREVYASSAGRAFTGLKLRSKGSSNQLGNGKGSDTGDSMSVRSYALNSEPAAETESLFGDVLGTGQDNPQWDIRLGEEAAQRVLNIPTIEIDDAELDFEKEFSPVGELDSDGQNEGMLMYLSCIHLLAILRSTAIEALLDSWKSKQKHFLILSAAGKPIYTRHGDDGVISSYIGILQTIISFYQGSDDPLKSFSAGEARFVVLSKGPLHLVAVSRLVESDAQLRLQLDALYMQILSTLTLPTLTHLFSIRPSTDLRRPLQGTETLLSSLADSFTRGSPPTLLSALECLKIRKAHRAVINNTLLKCRVDTLLYGLVVAGGRLVSVVRPKRHSLHPGDLQLIFNMVFEADGVKAGGGEPWIPICLPGFNNKGYLYMYVSFLELQEDKVKEINPNVETTAIKDDAVAILLISANKEGFFDLQKMKNSVVEVNMTFVLLV
jgi:hypothetical protein